MTKALIVLGSTGSIGRQTLAVARALNLPVKALSAGYNRDLLLEQILEFKPEMVSLAQAADASWLEKQLASAGQTCNVAFGRQGNVEVASWPGADTVVAAMVGVAGLEPVLTAIRQGKNIALANKETLVSGGALVMPLLEKYNSRLLPVDSEHSAIWQCLIGQPDNALERIFLTASGGPFRGWPKEQLEDVTVDLALKHPTWQMGPKITIDSATLMNKGLEVIEAAWLFNCPLEQIEVVVHPQSIIHSMVELKDGSVLAQMGFPDMKLPIRYALTWPERVKGDTRPFDPFTGQTANLTFERPDLEAFPLLNLAYAAAETGGTLPAVLNAANEAAVGLFLKRRITFGAISRLVEAAMDRHLKGGFMTSFNFDDMMEQDRLAREYVLAVSDSQEGI